MYIFQISYRLAASTVTCINAVVANSIRKIALSCCLSQTRTHGLLRVLNILIRQQHGGEKTEYGLEACPLRKSDCSSLDLVVNRFFMKLFKTNNIDVVNYCRMQFNFELPSVTIAQQFADKYRLCDNALCKSFVFR